MSTTFFKYALKQERIRCYPIVVAFFYIYFSRLSLTVKEEISRTMSDPKPTYLTTEGLQNLKDEIHFLRTQERPRISQAIADARAQGDLSENAEYDAAKEEQGLLEARIAKLENTVATARLLDESQVDLSKAYILSTVSVKNTANGMKQAYTLVSEQEADFTAGKISITSPIGKGLLGKTVGDKIDIKVPAGKVTLEILDISRS